MADSTTGKPSRKPPTTPRDSSLKTPKKKVGRPKRKFITAQIGRMGELALAGCQNNTIATILDIPIDTLTRHFAKLLTKKRAERKMVLREQQNRAAEAGSVAIQIWLGKNELGQKDQMQTTIGLTDELSDLMKDIRSNGEGIPIKT